MNTFSLYNGPYRIDKKNLFLYLLYMSYMLFGRVSDLDSMQWILDSRYWISVLGALYFGDSNYKAKDSGFPYRGRVFNNPVIL